MRPNTGDLRAHDRGGHVRSFVYFGLVAFVASYYERVLDVSPALGNTASR